MLVVTQTQNNRNLTHMLQWQ